MEHVSWLRNEAALLLAAAPGCGTHALGGPVFQVVRSAEEAASTLASSIHPEQCIKVLCPIIQTADYPINLAAIKMQTKVVERIARESLLQLLADIIPGLLQVGWAWCLRAGRLGLGG